MGMKTFFPFLCSVLLVCSCTIRNKPADIPETPESSSSGWYYFSDQGIHAAESPAEIPQREFKPWTEAVRVSDAAVLPEGPVFLINKLGVMTPGKRTVPAKLAEAPDYFPELTAAGFVQSANTTAVRLFRSTIFNSGDYASTDVFLLGYSPLTGCFSPISLISDLDLPGGTQCAGFSAADTRWYASFKTEKDNRIEFSYFAFDSLPVPGNPNGASAIDVSAYQQAVMPEPLNAAPDRLQGIISRIPDDTPVSIKLYPSGEGTTKTFVRNSGENIREGYALLYGRFAGLLFSDGTLYLDHDSVEIYRLPALSDGYRYTSFIFSGDRVLAAWEEQRFYKTGRAGILEISLDNGVY